MKIFTYIITVLAIGLIIYNATLINFKSFSESENIAAFITILAAICAILLLQILRISKKIEQKSKGK